MAEAHGSFSGGRWAPSVSQRTFDHRNAVDADDLLGVLSGSDGRDVERAVAAASQSLASWKAMPASESAESQRRTAEPLVARAVGRKEWLPPTMTRGICLDLSGVPQRAQVDS